MTDDEALDAAAFGPANGLRTPDEIIMRAVRIARERGETLAKLERLLRKHDELELRESWVDGLLSVRVFDGEFLGEGATLAEAIANAPEPKP